MHIEGLFSGLAVAVSKWVGGYRRKREDEGTGTGTGTGRDVPQFVCFALSEEGREGERSLDRWNVVRFVGPFELWIVFDFRKSCFSSSEEDNAGQGGRRHVLGLPSCSWRSLTKVTN